MEQEIKNVLKIENRLHLITIALKYLPGKQIVTT